MRRRVAWLASLDTLTRLLDLSPCTQLPPRHWWLPHPIFTNPNRRPWTTDSVMIVTGSLYQKMAFTVHFPTPPLYGTPASFLARICYNSHVSILADVSLPNLESHVKRVFPLFASTKVLAYIRSFDHVCFLGLGRFFNRSIIINNACSDNEMVLFWDRNFAFSALEKMGRRNIDCISAVDEVFGRAVPASGLRKLSIELSSSEWTMVFVWKAAGRWVTGRATTA
jgi:hypothetical protein